MLLAPAGHQSLAALGDLLGIEKLELPEGAIERMDLLRESNPALFEKSVLGGTGLTICSRGFNLGITNPRLKPGLRTMRGFR